MIGSLEEHLESDKEDADIMQSNAHEDRTLITTSTSTERRRKRTRETTSSVQSIARASPPDTYDSNAPRRNKKRGKRSPLPVIVQPASAPRRSVRRNVRSHIAAAQAASARREESDPVSITDRRVRAPLRKSPRKRNTGSHTTTAQLVGDKTDDNLQAIDQHESTLDDDYDDQCGEGEKGSTSSLAASKPSAKSFDERFEALMEFKDAFGHCNAPQTRSSEYCPLGCWCSKLRVSYKQIQKGETPHRKLTDDHIRRLEEAGFNWTPGSQFIFDARLEELMKFKQKFGHCNAPQTKSGEYHSLGMWCKHVRMSYKKIQKGESPRNKLTDDHIRRLEEVGFKWRQVTTFDAHFEELAKFKQKFGHCNARQTKSSEYYSLGCWCSNVRMAYKQIQKGGKPRFKLTDDHIRRLEEAGFNWSPARPPTCII